MLSPVAALLLCTGISVSYVLGIYLFNPTLHLPRDSPQAIRVRMRNVTVISTINAIGVPLVISITAPAPLSYHHLVPQASAIATGALLVAVLYAAPILHYLLHESAFWKADAYESFATLAGFRNHVFAPLTEEVVYTACLLTVCAAAGMSPTSATLYTPLFFGVAHLHHAWERYRAGQSGGEIALQCFFQMLYTSLFGMFTNHLFFATKNVWAGVAAHVLCNLMGLPRLTITGPWYEKVIYSGLLLAGVAGFTVLLRAL